MSRARDENDLLLAGELPADPGEGAVPYNPDADEVPRPQRAARSIVFVDAVEIAKPLPDVEYLVPHLGLASGAPVLVAGYGFAGKTVALQSMALSVATGLPLWGVYGVQRGAVAHLDYEQGDRVTRERYQRMARAMGFDLRELGDTLRLAVHPDAHLDEKDPREALDVYRRAIEGASLVIVDSLRASAPSLDENSSEVRRCLDLLNRAAEPSGAVVAVIHHVRKPKADDPQGARYRIRGSGALYDASGSVFVLAAEKGQPTRVEHEKCRNRGVLIDDFGLRVEDVEVGGDAKGGLRVVHLEAEQLTRAETRGPSPHHVAMVRIGEYLRSIGEYRGTKSGLLGELRMGRSRFYGACNALVSSGAALEGRDDRGAYIRWVGDGSSSDSSRDLAEPTETETGISLDSLGGGTGRDRGDP